MNIILVNLLAFVILAILTGYIPALKEATGPIPIFIMATLSVIPLAWVHCPCVPVLVGAQPLPCPTNMQPALKRPGQSCPICRRCVGFATGLRGVRDGPPPARH